MPVRTNIANGFLFRLAIVALVGIGFSLWALYDGAIGYPAQQERALKYEEFMGDDNSMSEEEDIQWQAYATEQGWSVDDPGSPKTKFDIAGQFVMMGIALPFGLLFLYFFLRNKGRWIEADQNGLRTSWNQQVNYDQIETLNKRNWKKKGIARINYLTDGRKQQLVLDDFKYDFEQTKQVLLAVEERLEIDQFVDGVPEEDTTDEESAKEPVGDVAADAPGDNGPASADSTGD